MLKEPVIWAPVLALVLQPTLEKALADKGVSIIACPVDYSENMKLTDRLGELTMRL